MSRICDNGERTFLIVLVEHESAGALSESWTDEEGIIVRQALTDEMVERLVGSSEAEE